MYAVADTSFVIALLNVKDRYHKISTDYYGTATDDIYLPQSTFAELGYMLSSRPEKLTLIRVLRDLETPRMLRFRSVRLITAI
jgi:predicted nucleic acid-binding protein